MSHIGKLRHLLARLNSEWDDTDDDDDPTGSPEPEELQHRPSRWSRSPEPAGQPGSQDRWSDSPQPANVAPIFGAPDTEEDLLQLLATSFPREHIANMVRIRWKLKTVYDLYKITSEEIDEVRWLESLEKMVLRRLCGIE
jgi:hypothetical protein